MKDDNSLDRLLMQVAEMIQMIQKHKGPISENVTPRVLEEIKRLEVALALFDDVHEKVLRDSNIDMEHLKIETLHSPEIPLKERQLLQRAKAIERDARHLRLAFSKALERGKGKKTQGVSKKMKERRKLFKPLGGDKHWIPL